MAAMGDRTIFENDEGLQECNKSDLLRPTSVRTCSLDEAYREDLFLQ